tara:strand:- start:584 stop:778 length:195 start_codon:yes stop_codon:yes gene_type:complete
MKAEKDWEYNFMDTQLNNYEVLKNGKNMGYVGTLEEMVKYIRFLESFLDRSKEHSPYTIGRKND